MAVFTLPGAYSLYNQLYNVSQNQPKSSRMYQFFQNPYVSTGIPIAGFGAGAWGDTWRNKLLNKDIRERRAIRTNRLGLDMNYITQRTGEEFADRGTAGSTLHKEELAHRLRPAQEELSYMAQAHRSRRRSRLYDLLFGGD